MKVKLVQLQGVWSFDSQGPCTIEFNNKTIIIGKNNSGKSNILKGINWFKNNIAHFRTNQKLPKIESPVSYRMPDGSDPPSSILLIKLQFSSIEAGKVLDQALFRDEIQRVDAKELLTKAVCFVCNTDWPLARQQERGLLIGEPAEHLVRQLEAHKIDRSLSDSLRNAIIQNVAEKISFISGWRSVRENDNEVPKNLRTMLNPPAKEHTLKALEKRLTRFFRGLTGLQEATLHVEPRHDNISIYVGERYLPLENFGDGIHHLLLLAYQFAKFKDCVFLLEEPETHIHPGLQRHLFRYLGALESDNQYIITTHSPVLLDCIRDASILRTEYDGESTKVYPCVTANDTYKVLDQLDVRASDILQANLVIWVEGPTDRMFIKHYLDLRKPGFEEGLDYTFSYYGGRLMSHATLDENEKGLINLLRLSRNAVVVCDSDKESEDKKINDTKKRLEKECNNCGAMFWVTEGREIENYIHDSVLTEAYKELLGDDSISLSLQKYGTIDNALGGIAGSPEHGDGWKRKYGENKVRIMSYLLKKLKKEHLKQYDLPAKLDELIQRIEQANPEALPTP